MDKRSNGRGTTNERDRLELIIRLRTYMWCGKSMMWQECDVARGKDLFVSTKYSLDMYAIFSTRTYVEPPIHKTSDKQAKQLTFYD